tara:strand:+ start:1897 stop:2073 length:177 start_codon:yes stop_codon:yes gene_type:complete
MDHVHLWEEKFTKKETDNINKLHNQSLVKKKDIATEENYQKLRRMLNAEKDKGFARVK